VIGCLLRRAGAMLAEVGTPHDSLSILLPPPTGSLPGQGQPRASGCADLRVIRRLQQRPRTPEAVCPRGSPARHAVPTIPRVFVGRTV